MEYVANTKTWKEDEVMIKFLVKGQNIEMLEHEIIAADQIAFVKIHFAFDNNWKPLHKVVQFTQDEITYNRVLGTENTSCFLPAELTAGTVKMSLFGYDVEATETSQGNNGCKNLAHQTIGDLRAKTVMFRLLLIYISSFCRRFLKKVKTADLPMKLL